MTASEVDAGFVERSLQQRLEAVRDILRRGAGPAPEQGPGDLLEDLVVAVQQEPSLARVWLLCVAVFGTYPVAEDVVSARRRIELDDPMHAMLWFLDQALEDDFEAAARNRIVVVSDRVIVDVDHSARRELHTGIQQVVRRVLPLWEKEHEIEPVAWADGEAGWRTLSPLEEARVLNWGQSHHDRLELPAEDGSSDLVVPWQTTAVLLEVPPVDACKRLAALAQYSGSTLVAVGYDCVPVASADLVPPAEPVRFTRFLAALKHARRISAISNSACQEFSGLAEGLTAQGLPAPEVFECKLADEPLLAAEADEDGRSTAAVDRPRVLSVGTFEPRKNHLAVLHAAELLWREGLDFELVLIGGSAWGDEVSSRAEELSEQGRPVTVRRSVSGADVAAAYRDARFSVFPSLHEGYGLPIVESLGVGTPVIAANYGSAAEIGLGGGVLAVDPRDDEQLIGAMRLLLTDDDLVSRLATAARHRPVRTWNQYATELWSALVEN